MKILCRQVDFEDFRPAPFDKEIVEDIVDDVYTAILNKYGRRFKNISVEIDNILYDDYTIEFDVDVFNGDNLKFSDKFEFVPYSDYWDLTDYDQHLATTVSRFVNNLSE